MTEAIRLTSPAAIKAAYLKNRQRSEPGAISVYEMDYISPEGRVFSIDELENGTWHLSELLPNGRCYREVGEGKSPEFWADDRILDLMDDPNGLRAALRDIGINDHEVIRTGGGYTIGTIYYDSLEDVCEAIYKSIRENVWYESVDYTLRDDPEFKKKMEEEHRILLEEYREEVIAQHEMSLKEKGLFNGLHSLMGPLTDDAKHRLLCYLYEQTVENWKKVYSLSIKGVTTVWQACAKVDPKMPMSIELDGEWTYIPDRETFVTALRKVAAKPDLREYRESDEEDLGDEDAEPKGFRF